MSQSSSPLSMSSGLAPCGNPLGRTGRAVLSATLDDCAGWMAFITINGEAFALTGESARAPSATSSQSLPRHLPGPVVGAVFGGTGALTDIVVAVPSDALSQSIPRHLPGSVVSIA